MKKKGIRKGSLLPEPVSASRIQFDGKLKNRFYEPLVLQHALGGDPGSRISRPPLDNHNTSGYELDGRELRRSFLDLLAYICDYKKQGATVTAIALERTCAGEVVFWIAANEDVDERVVPFLKGILADLKSPDVDRAVTEEKIFKRAVEFGAQRVKAYWELVQKHSKNCSSALHKGDKDLMAWLVSFQDYSDDMLRLCRFAYENRATESMKKLVEKSSETSSCFSQVRHYIGRLSMHMKAAKRLVDAAERLPGLFGDPQIKCCPSPKPSSRPAMTKKLTLGGIVNRMLPQNDKRIPYYQEALKSMDRRIGVFERMKKKYEDPKFIPRVHAELILLEHFHTKKYDFIDNDKYIGCSKHACYCCYHYIRAHPGGFVHPASHYKNYLNWSPPEVIDDDEDAAKERREFLNNMIANIRKDVLKQIDEQRGPHDLRHDSTTGITASAALE